MWSGSCAADLRGWRCSARTSDEIPVHLAYPVLPKVSLPAQALPHLPVPADLLGICAGGLPETRLFCGLLSDGQQGASVQSVQRGRVGSGSREGPAQQVHSFPHDKVLLSGGVRAGTGLQSKTAMTTAAPCGNRESTAQDPKNRKGAYCKITLQLDHKPE